MPIRPLALTSPEPFEATATLRHVASGRSVALRDSMFRYDPGDWGVGADTVYLHNFWTPEPIEAGESYRLVVAAVGQDPAEAIVEIPREYSVELWLAQSWTPSGLDGSDLLVLTGVNHVPFVSVNTYSKASPGCYPSRERNLVTRVRTSGLEHKINLRREARAGCIVEKWDLWMVGSTNEWPTGADFVTWRLGVPGAPGNVSNSVGFIGGVLTREIPYDRCTLLNATPAETHCRLDYGWTSASLHGTVSDAVCAAEPIPDARIELIEIGSVGSRKLRWSNSYDSGEYEIGGLEPGTRYALTVHSRIIGPDNRERYAEHTDTLEFRPGERARYDIALPRQDGCGFGR